MGAGASVCVSVCEFMCGRVDVSVGVVVGVCACVDCRHKFTLLA